MKMKLAKLKRIAILLAGISTASIPTLVQANWSINGLGTLGGVTSYARGINDSGQVVGSSNIIGDSAAHAFITGSNGIGMTDLGTLGGTFSFANDINDFGQVVGWTSTADSMFRAFITAPKEALIKLIIPVLSTKLSAK